MKNNKIVIILIGILLFIILVCLLFWGHNKFMNSKFKPGPDKIATQSIAVVYHPYNDGIIQLANIIGSQMKADIYKLEPVKPYPTSADLAKDQMKNEYEHPERVLLKTNYFDLKKYHIIFIGVPIINNKTSPLVMRFVLDIEKLLNKNKIIIPFVYYQGNDESKDAYQFLYKHTRRAKYKNGFTSSVLNNGANTMEIDTWLKDMRFQRSDIERTKKSNKSK